MAEAEDKKVSGANFLLIFQQEVQTLMITTAGFINIIKQMKTKYPQFDSEKTLEIEGMDENDQATLTGGIQDINIIVYMTYLKFRGLAEEIDAFKEKEKEVEAVGKKLLDSPIPSIEDLNEYNLIFVKIFVKGIVGELLGSAGAILRDLMK